MLPLSSSEASIVNAQLAADKTALQKCTDFEAAVGHLESQNRHMEVEMQNINNKQNSGSFEADAKTSAAGADRLKEALEDAKADSARLRKK